MLWLAMLLLGWLMRAQLWWFGDIDDSDTVE